MSRDQRKIPKDSSFLQPKESKLPPSDDPTSPREMKRARTSQEQRESPQDSSFLLSKDTETSSSFVSPMNRDEEALKRFPDSAGSQKNLESIQNLGYVNSSVIGVHSGTWFANPDEDIHQANDTLQRLGIPGEGYDTNNPYLFGSGGNIASMSSQRGSLIPEMQQKMSNVSNNSMGDGVGMHTKSIDSGEGYTNNPVAGHNVGMNVKSLDSGSSFTRDPQHAYDKEKIYMIPTPISSVKAPSWTITKKLRKTDVRGPQLNLFADPALSHIRQHLSGADSKIVDSGEHVTVNVYDFDCGTMHMLEFVCVYRRYFLRGPWREEFVQRRDLNEGDEIGLLWDKSAYRLQFGVVSRADATTPAKEKKLVIR